MSANSSAPQKAHIHDQPRRLYDMASGRFDPSLLGYELLIREMTTNQLAAAAGCARSSAYKAMSGRGVSQRVAFGILGALGRHPQTFTLRE